MSAPEPDGCYFEWDSPEPGHTCLEDAHHEGPHVCGCGAQESGEQEHCDTP